MQPFIKLTADTGGWYYIQPNQILFFRSVICRDGSAVTRIQFIGLPDPLHVTETLEEVDEAINKVL